VADLTPAEHLVAKRMHKKLMSAVHFLGEARECAGALSPEALVSLKTQDALVLVLKKIDGIRDLVKGENKEVTHGG
jgi:hypothetical protein